jgi:hypothetical protein
MSRVTEAGMDGALEEVVQRTEQRAVGEREVRWSARRKEGVVMRLLRGESLDLLARETGQPAGRISAWREEFLAGGREGLKSRPAPVEDRRLAEALNPRESRRPAHFGVPPVVPSRRIAGLRVGRATTG